MDLEVTLDSFDPTVFGDSRGRPPRVSSLPGFLRRDRQRLVPNRRNGHHSVQHEHAGRDRRRDHDQFDHPRGRRASQGAAQADPGSARDALELIHLENMLTVTRAGAVVLPAMPGWYHRPRRLDDMINFVVARICDQLGIDNNLITRWGNEAGPDTRTRVIGISRSSSTSHDPNRSREREPMPADGDARVSRPGPGRFAHRSLGRHRGGPGTRAGSPARRRGRSC